MSWYKKAQLSKKLLKNIEKKKQISLQKGWTPEEVNWVADISTKLNDPSYFLWLLEQTRNGSANIQTREDDKKIFEALEKFDELKKKKLISEDINKFKTFADLYEVVKDFLEQQGRSYMQDVGSMGGAKLLYNENNISVIEVRNSKAGQELFRDSGWCVKEPEQFDHYGPPFYLFRKYNENYALFHAKYGDFKDVADKSMRMRETIPLLPSFNFLFQSEIIDPKKQRLGDIRVIPEIMQQKETTNKLCEIGDMQALDNVISSDLEYSNLIEKFNLTPEIVDLVKNNFLKTRGKLSKPEEINDFYHSIPVYLDQAGILPTEQEKSIVSGAMDISIDRDSYEMLEKGYLDLNYPSKIVRNLETINNLYRKLHKSLKTDKIKREAVRWNKMIIKSAPEAIELWAMLPEELKRECLPEAQKGAADEIRRDPKLYYDPEQQKQIPPELITENLKNASYRGVLQLLPKKPYLSWEQKIPPEFRTDDFDNILYEARIKGVPTKFSSWEDMDEIFKTKELWNKFYSLALNSIQNSYSPSIISRIPDEFKTEELIALYYQHHSEQAQDYLPAKIMQQQKELLEQQLQNKVNTPEQVDPLQSEHKTN
ncbi:MAG: hypothetical protein ACTSSP_00520 [Candidatus Asgardarchaeia archaeon]